LNYLQNFGGLTDRFLYVRSARGGITLLHGVAYCLRRFYTLVQHMSRTRWVEHIKANRRNHAILGDAGDLEDFLFSPSRQSLAIVGAQLRKLDGVRCFYCGCAITEADVDHFVPFSLYPRDQAHNLVLAHPTCNRSKSDTLAARPHLERLILANIRFVTNFA
jgi:5-methylcytosine-specific restriction endonuclease McrA